MEWTVYREFPVELENEWNLLLDESITHVPFLRHEYLNIWWQTRGGGEWKLVELAIAAARQDGHLLGIAPLFITRDIQNRPTLMLLGSVEISDYLDLIVRPQDLNEFVRGLFKLITSSNFPKWQILDWCNLLDTSLSVQVIQEEGKKQGLDVGFYILQHSPYIPLTGNFDSYLSGIDKKQRHEIRRKMRRAEESNRGVKWYLARDPERIIQDIDDFFALMALDEEKKAFLTPAMRDHFRQTILCAFQVGCLHLAFLEIDGEKAAGHFSFDYLNRLWAYNSGINTKYNDMSPGWVFLGYELRWANENGYSEYDFMRGDEEYKYRFGAIDRSVIRITMGNKNSN